MWDWILHPRTPTLGDALDERRLTGAQITLQTDHVACLQGCAQARPDAAGLFGAATEKIHRGDIQVLHL